MLRVGLLYPINPEEGCYVTIIRPLSDVKFDKNRRRMPDTANGRVYRMPLGGEEVQHCGLPLQTQAKDH